MSDPIKAPINYAITAGGQFVKGGSVIFGFQNIRPDADNPATLKPIFLDSALSSQAANPQGLSSDAVFDQADNGVLFGADDDIYSIIILDANGVELSYIPSYYLADATAATSAQASAIEAQLAASQAITAQGLAEAAQAAAEQAAIEAAQSAQAASDSLSEFVDQYWGSYASEPALSPVGNPATNGDLYFNETQNSMRVYNGSAWQSAASSVSGIRNSYNFTNIAGQTVFNAVYDVGFVDVLYNGVEMSPDNYTANDGLTVVLNTPVDKADDEINIKAYNYVDFGDASNLPVTATGTTTPRALADRFADTLHIRDGGAICDGVVDDTEAVRSLHALANSTGAEVSYSGVGTIAIQADAHISVNTSVDFSGCTVVVLDGIKVTPGFTNVNTMFVIEDPATPVVNVVGAVDAADLLEGSLTPTKGLFDGQGYAALTCGLQIPNRDETGTVDYEQSFCVIRNGQAALPLSTDLSAFAAAITVDYRNMSKSKVYIRNFAVGEEGWNNQVLLRVNRNNVEINGFTFSHENGAEFNNINQLIKLEYCCDIEIRNVIASGQPVTVSIGSYVIEIDYAAEIQIDNFQSIWLGWPSTGTNHTNGLYYTNSTVTRIDSHAGGHNTFVDNCTLSQRGVEYGWGGGQIKVTNCSALQSLVVSTRGDYSGQFFGTIIVDGVEVDNKGTSGLVVVDLEAGASTPVQHPRSIIIRNVHRRGRTSGGGYSGSMLFNLQRRGISAVYAPYYIELQNWTSDRPNYCGGTLDLGGMDMAASTFRTTLVVSNLFGDRIPSEGQGFVFPTPTIATGNEVKLFMTFSLCKMLLVDFRLVTIVESVDVGHCDVVGILANPADNSDITISDVRLQYAPSGYVGNIPLGGGSSGTSKRTSITNARVYPIGIDMTLASALQGVMMMPGAGVTTDLPATCTIDLAFTGFKTVSFD